MRIGLLEKKVREWESNRPPHPLALEPLGKQPARRRVKEYVFADVMIVGLQFHCGYWVLVLRTCALAFMLNLLLLELVRIQHLRIPKIRLFRKSK